MKCTNLLLACLVFCCVLSCARSAVAQRPGRYRPHRPTLSPYLDYFRRDTGLTNQYYTYIRPRRQLERFARDQQSQVRSLRQQLQQVREPTVRPTGIHGGFMNYSHYYQYRQPAGRRR